MTCLAFEAQVWAAEQAGPQQRTFASPQEATKALVQAAQAQDQQGMRAIFGPEVTNLWTGDQVLDQRHMQKFARDLKEKCEIVPQVSGKATLAIGTNSWAFPIPLVQTDNGWRFDTVAGEDEIINRHIGQDEYYAIGVCRAFVKAQRDYAAQSTDASGTPRYADRLKSTPGTKDGLYWRTEANGQPSPLSSYVADACLEKYNWPEGKGPRPFHGYFFKILTRQGSAAPGGKKNYEQNGEMTGGFALVAYPVRWGESGIMTFIVNQDGVVYQRSLGEKTAKKAEAMKEFNPDKSWSVVQESGIMDLGAGQVAENAR